VIIDFDLENCKADVGWGVKERRRVFCDQVVVVAVVVVVPVVTLWWSGLLLL
jgi:hypothetical protein